MVCTSSAAVMDDQPDYWRNWLSERTENSMSRATENLNPACKHINMMHITWRTGSVVLGKRSLAVYSWKTITDDH